MIDRILNNQLCLGCGLCQSAFGKDTCEMVLSETGFYQPRTKRAFSKEEEKKLQRLCPGVHVEAQAHKGVWGSMLSIADAWSSDENIRFRAASGGVITSLAIYLLETHQVDAILQVGVCNDSYLYNELKVSHTRDEVMKNAQSRYAPALFFSEIKHLFDTTNETFALVGKPCDMAAMQNFCREYKEYDGRISYYLSIFCAGMPSYLATEQTWRLSGHRDTPIRLKYRGDGWPGNFKAEFTDGSNFQLSYNESWGKILGKSVGFRCKICPDGIGLLADISVGDSWNTKDGYPDFTESKGRCFCMIRTQRGAHLFDEAKNAGYIEVNHLDVSRIKEMQAYQYRRRQLVGWRLLPVQILNDFILNFKGLGTFSLALKANYRRGVSELLGSFKRLTRLRKELNGK